MIPPVGLNARAAALVDALVADADRYGVAVARGSLGETLIDAGAKARGGVEAGLRIAEICLGGLGTVALVPVPGRKWPWTIAVRSSRPVLACLASQYAGWRLAHGEGKGAFMALGSGPARAVARPEKLFDEIGYGETAERAVLVLESALPPPGEVVAMAAKACRLDPKAMTFIYAPTQSRAGDVQVVARVVEVALHKAHELGFPLARIVEGLGEAPMAPPHPDFVKAMGRTNDAIIYGGEVHLFVEGPEDEAEELARRMPSSASRDHGRPFAEIFRQVKGDFYAIDPMLFSPASVIVTALGSGRTFRAGQVDLDLLDASFA